MVPALDRRANGAARLTLIYTWQARYPSPKEVHPSVLQQAAKLNSLGAQAGPPQGHDEHTTSTSFALPMVLCPLKSLVVGPPKHMPGEAVRASTRIACHSRGDVVGHTTRRKDGHCSRELPVPE